MSHNEGSFWVTGALYCACFTNDKAAQIAVQTVQEYLEETPDSSVKNVIFNVFKNEDLQIYERILRS